jgi:hypothetical protein
MADFYTNYPAQQKPMTLGEMLNMASGVQNYQQAQQMNPLALQKAQQEVEQARQINPLALRQKQTETEKAEFDFESQKADKSRQILGALAQSEAFQSGDRNKMLLEIADTQKELERSGSKPHQALLAVSALIAKVMQDPQSAKPFLDNAVRQGNTAAGQQTLQNGQIVTVNGVQLKYNSANNQFMPIGEGSTPLQANQPAQPKGNELFREDMPIKPSAVMQLNTMQQGRYGEGEKMVSQSIEAMRQANEMTQSIRKIEETITAASGSKPGQLVRDAIKGVMGDAQLETLTKNLEDLYVRNTEALGGNTDAARESIRKISGSPDMTVQALQGIIDRVKASSHELKKYNQGLSNYAKNTSTENANIHARQYRNAWVQNSDPLIFMAQTINSSNKSQAEKEMMRQKMLKGLTDDEITELNKKAKRIKALEAGNRVEND